MTLNVCMQIRVLKYMNYQICSNDDSGLTVTYFTTRSNLLPYAFVWKLVKPCIFQKLLLSIVSNMIYAVN